MLTRVDIVGRHSQGVQRMPKHIFPDGHKAAHHMAQPFCTGSLSGQSPSELEVGGVVATRPFHIPVGQIYLQTCVAGLDSRAEETIVGNHSSSLEHKP